MAQFLSIYFTPKNFNLSIPYLYQNYFNPSLFIFIFHLLFFLHHLFLNIYNYIFKRAIIIPFFCPNDCELWPNCLSKILENFNPSILTQKQPFSVNDRVIIHFPNIRKLHHYYHYHYHYCYHNYYYNCC